MSDDLRNRVAQAIAYSGDIREKREWSDLLHETREHYRKQADAALEAAKAEAYAAGQKAVKIRPLVWDSHPDAEYDPKCNEHYAGGQDNLVGVNEYCIYPHPCALGMFVLDVMNNRCDDDFQTVEAAKSAAQADYETRIRAAIMEDKGDE